MRLSVSKIFSFYKFTVLTITSVIFLFVALNLIIAFLFFGISLFKEPANPIKRAYGAEKFSELYGGLDDDEINTLLNECWDRPFRYRQYTDFVEAPIAGKYVNVDENGIRRSRNQGSWPPLENDYSIFVFGGSTTFGYGVADDQTLPSRIQEHFSKRLQRKNIRVYNLGCGSYHSSRERILFFELLQKNIIPDVAIFIDGLNDFCHDTDGLEEMETRINNAFHNRINFPFSDFIKTLPAHKLTRSVEYFVKSFRAQKHKVTPLDQIEQDLNSDRFNDPTFFDFVTMRYLNNMKFIREFAAEYDIEPIFIWQPHPTYKFDLKNHYFLRRNFNSHGYARQGYAYFARWLQHHPLGDHFVWCADIQLKNPGPHYIDKVHYSPDFSDYFAKTIVQLILERNLIKEP